MLAQVPAEFFSENTCSVSHVGCFAGFHAARVCASLRSPSYRRVFQAGLPLSVRPEQPPRNRAFWRAQSIAKSLTNYFAARKGLASFLHADLPTLCLAGKIQPLQESLRSDVERIANSQKCCERNRATCFDLLPMPSREAKTDHVFLTVAAVKA